jgi:hypothetical protein
MDIELQINKRRKTNPMGIDAMFPICDPTTAETSQA